MLCEMPSASSRIWTRVTMSISYNDNHYTMVLSLLWLRFTRQLQKNFIATWYFSRRNSNINIKKNKVCFSCGFHVDSFDSLTIHPYQLGLLDCIHCPHRADACLYWSDNISVFLYRISQKNVSYEFILTSPVCLHLTLMVCEIGG